VSTVPAVTKNARVLLTLSQTLKVDILTIAKTVFENNVTIIQANNFTFETEYSNQISNFVKNYQIFRF
jgi:hypothetical protein